MFTSLEPRRLTGLFIAMLFGFLSNLRAVVPGEDAAAILKSATAFLNTPGSYKGMRFKDLGGNKTEATTQYVKILPDGTRLRRIEVEMRTLRVRAFTVHIENEEGSWALRKKVAIHGPGMFDDVLEPGLHNRRESAQDSQNLQLTRVSEGGKPYLRIVQTYTEEQQSALEKVGLDMSKRLSASAPRGADMKQLARQVRAGVPSRIEFWIEPDTRQLILQRSFGKTGNLLKERRYDGFETVPELPDDFFQIPADYERVFPQTFEGYVAELRKHSPAESLRKAGPTKKPVAEAPKPAGEAK